MDVIDPNENPYVAVAGRKSRNLKKKLEKIMKVEAQKNEGKKPLNEEQLVLLTTRGSVEKALHDIESIKTQLEDVARDDKLHKTKELEQLQAALEEARATAVTAEASTHTITQDQSCNSTQYEHVETGEENHVACGPDISGSADTNQVAAAYHELMKLNIYKLLKLFHVCARYPMLTGNDLPPDIIYFGKCLMGETSISGFKETLQQSARNAELYLDEDMGSKYEAIRGMSYMQIADIIDTLAAEFDTPPASVPSMTSQQAPPPQSPQINFFADEDVEAVSGGALEESAQQDGFANELQGVYGSNEGLSSTYSTSSPFPLPPTAQVMGVGIDDSTNWTASLNGMSLESPTAPTAAVVESVQQQVVAVSGVSSESDPVHVPEQTSGVRKASAPGGKGRGSGKSRGRGGRGASKGGESKGTGHSAQADAGSGAVSAESTTTPSETVAEGTTAARPKAWGANSKAGGALAAVTSQPPASTKPRPAGGAAAGSRKPTSAGDKKPASGAPHAGRKPDSAPAGSGGAGAARGPRPRPARGPPPASAGRGSGGAPSSGGRGAGAGKPRENRPPRERTGGVPAGGK